MVVHSAIDVYRTQFKASDAHQGLEWDLLQGVPSLNAVTCLIANFLACAPQNPLCAVLPMVAYAYASS